MGFLGFEDSVDDDDGAAAVLDNARLQCVCIVLIELLRAFVGIDMTKE